MIRVHIPHGGPNQIIGTDGKRYDAHLIDGHLVIDLPPRLFQLQLMGRQGLAWQHANPKACAYLGTTGFDNIVNGPIFPDAVHPAPAAAPVKAEAAPIMVRLIAPEGVTSYSHGGAEQKVGKDRTVTVDDRVASVLRSHGFKGAA